MIYVKTEYKILRDTLVRGFHEGVLIDFYKKVDADGGTKIIAHQYLSILYCFVWYNFLDHYVCSHCNSIRLLDNFSSTVMINTFHFLFFL